MASVKKIISSRENIKKAQAKWKRMGHRARAIAQPSRKGRISNRLGDKEDAWTTGY